MKRKTIDIITYVILAVLIIFALIVFLPKIFGYSALYVEAQSMEPTIKKAIWF